MMAKTVFTEMTVMELSAGCGRCCRDLAAVAYRALPPRPQ